MLELLEPVASSAEALAGRLAGVSFALLAVALALHTARMAARARAWHNITRAAYPDEGLRFRHSLGAYLCGAGTNAVLPARPGELLKLALVRHKAPATAYPGLASTLLAESLFDTVTWAAVLASGIALGWTSFGGALPAPLAFLARHPWLIGTVAIAVAAIALAAHRRLGRRLGSLAAGASRGLTVLRQPKCYLRTVVSWQLAALVLRLASIVCFLAAFHLPATIATALIVLAVQSAANLIPLTPNGAGTQQALLVVAFGTGAAASSVVAFGAGAQLATVAAEVVLAAVSLVLMTGSMRWTGLAAPHEARDAATDPVPAVP
jgi:Lysylphosphatidylglycerol synthase TM region